MTCNLLGLFAMVGSGCRPPPQGVVPAPEELPSAESLFEAHLSAIGGREAVLAHRSLHMLGEVESGGRTAIAEWVGHAPDSFRATVTFDDGLRLGQGYDGRLGWTWDPSLRVVDGSDLVLLQRDALFYSEVEYDRYVDRMRTLGRVEWAGRQAFAVQVDWDGGRTSRVFFDVDTGLRLGSELVPLIEGDPDATLVDAWRQVEGLMLPVEQTWLRSGATFGVRYFTVAFDHVPPVDVPPELLAAMDAPPARASLLRPLGLVAVELLYDDLVQVFLLDTGANQSALSAQAEQALGGPVAGVEMAGHGIGGDIDGLRMRRLPPFRIGERAYSEQGAFVMDLSALGPDVGFDGVLGSDFLSMHTVELDLGEGTATLWPRGEVPDTEGLGGVPFDLVEGIIAFDVLLDGRRIRAMLDTGGARSVATWSAARLVAGLSYRDSRVPLVGELVGADGTPLPVGAWSFDELLLGDVSLGQVDLGIAALPVAQRVFGGEPAVVLGVDLLGDRRVVVDYAGRMLYLSP